MLIFSVSFQLQHVSQRTGCGKGQTHHAEPTHEGLNKRKHSHPWPCCKHSHPWPCKHSHPWPSIFSPMAKHILTHGLAAVPGEQGAKRRCAVRHCTGKRQGARVGACAPATASHRPRDICTALPNHEARPGSGQT